MHRKQRRQSGKKITGSLEPFEVDPIQSIYRELFAPGNCIPENLLDISRETSKIVTALRMRPAVDMNRTITTISDESLKIITCHLSTHKHAADSGYIVCVLGYFLGKKPHNIVLNLDCASCKSRDPDKALTHARKDCEKFREKYIDKVLHKLRTKPWSNLSEAKIATLCNQYRAIEFSIEFVCAYLAMLCSGMLPRQLSAEAYGKASLYDNTLAIHYNYEVSNDVYSLNTRQNHSISSVNQECATYIFCSTYLTKTTAAY